MERVWFVTGAASGLGREIARAALQDDDTVIAADLSVEGAAELIAEYPSRAESVQLDVTDRGRIATVVGDVISRYGRIDVLVNSAGRGHIGSVEATTEVELRSLMELHFFGPAALTRAVLPSMRMRRSGAIIQVSSQAGQTSVPGMSAYSAGKFALEGMSISLAQEVAPLGIKVMIAQPGAMRTNFAGASISQSARIEDYEGTVGELRAHVEEVTGNQPGDPVRIATALLTALQAERTPLRLPLGKATLERLIEADKETHDERLAWEEVSRGTDFPS